MKWTPIKIESRTIPLAVRDAYQRLISHGHEAMLAGGCVRDVLLKRTPKDWDLVTNAPFDVLCLLFPQHILVGVAFGILKLPHTNIDIGIFRKESNYSDLRHPDHVEPGTLQTDMARRDFTINALYLNIATSKVLDGVTGIKDLRTKTIRTVGDPSARFSEDALRILRALRFSAQLGFKIEPQTKRAIAKHSSLLKAISRERIREEVLRALATSAAYEFLKNSAALKLWLQIFDVPNPKKFSWNSQKIKNFHPQQTFTWLGALAILNALNLKTDPLRFSKQELRKLHLIKSFFEACEGKKHRELPQVFVSLEQENPGLFKATLKCMQRLAPLLIKSKLKIWQQGVARLQKLANAPQPLPWPTGRQLLSEGIQEGQALGLALNQRSWRLFWKS